MASYLRYTLRSSRRRTCSQQHVRQIRLLSTRSIFEYFAMRSTRLWISGIPTKLDPRRTGQTLLSDVHICCTLILHPQRKTGAPRTTPRCLLILRVIFQSGMLQHSFLQRRLIGVQTSLRHLILTHVKQILRIWRSAQRRSTAYISSFEVKLLTTRDVKVSILLVCCLTLLETGCGK